MPLGDADAFWKDSLAAAARGERIVLGAFDGEALVGTVTLLLNLPPNQPHRAEIAKMMTRVSHRHRGVATALMQAAETDAIARGRTLLVLDTAVADGASKLYERLGFQLTGIIPDYALKPHDQGRRARRPDRRHPPRREKGRQVRALSRWGLIAPRASPSPSRRRDHHCRD